jgi:hypothetical protein
MHGEEITGGQCEAANSRSNKTFGREEDDLLLVGKFRGSFESADHVFVCSFGGFLINL